MHLMPRLIAAPAALLLLGACAGAEPDSAAEPEGAEAPGQSVSESDTAGDGPAGSPEPAQSPNATPAPASISIPAIDKDGPLETTGFNADRTLEVPEFGDMSWFEHGTRPGDVGPAAILGHVDSQDGPDVFFHLHEMTAGDEVFVDTEDGDTLTFEVDRVEQYPKDEFPTEEVWLPSSERELLLITCGGEFDSDERSYRDNIIAFATLSS